MNPRIQRKLLGLNWWIALVLLLTGAAIGLVFSFLQKPVYQSVTFLGFDNEQEAVSQQFPEPGYYCVFAENAEIINAAVESLQQPEVMALQYMGRRLSPTVKCIRHPDCH